MGVIRSLVQGMFEPVEILEGQLPGRLMPDICKNAGIHAVGVKLGKERA